MEVITNFFESLKDEIFDFYFKTYDYIKDLFSYKNIELKASTVGKTRESVKEIIETMIKVTKVSLKTIGVPKERVESQEEKFDEILVKKGKNYRIFDDYFKDIKEVLNYFLFSSILDYLTDVDKKQVETADLFDLFPDDFMEKIDQFKAKNISSKSIQENILKELPEIEETMNFSSLLMVMKEELKKEKVEEKKPKLLKKEKELKPEEIKPRITKKAQKQEEKIVFSSVTNENDKMDGKTKTPTSTEEIVSPTNKPVEIIEEIPISFLDYFGNFPTIESNILENFNINSSNISNLKNLKAKEFLNLETLFYLISISKMIGISFTFSNDEILDFVKDFINDDVFSSFKDETPDSFNMLYGLALFSELNLLDKSDIINIQKMKENLEADFAKVVPEKLNHNYFALLALRMLERKGIEISDVSETIYPIIQLNLSKMDDYMPIIDIYSQLASIKLHESKGKTIPTHFKGVYSKELKNLVQKNGSVNNTITDSAKMLLILDILNVKKKESDISKRIINYITKETKFFDSSEENGNFNWQNNELAFLVELRMLFWALLACSQYAYEF